MSFYVCICVCMHLQEQRHPGAPDVTRRMSELSDVFLCMYVCSMYVDLEKSDKDNVQAQWCLSMYVHMHVCMYICMFANLEKSDKERPGTKVLLPFYTCMYMYVMLVQVYIYAYMHACMHVWKASIVWRGECSCYVFYLYMYTCVFVELTYTLVMF